MIIVKLIGGLGNQMFQYAAGKCLSTLHNVPLLVDTSTLTVDPKSAYTKREFELDIFTCNPKIAKEKDIAFFSKRLNSNKYIRTLQRKLPILFSTIYFAESGHNYHKEFDSLPNNTYLDGFWQSERYFYQIKNSILNDFTFKFPLTENNQSISNHIQSTNSLSMHIRRGDYVSSSSALEFHGICDIDYYQNALKIIKEKYSNIELFIFSDDQIWCKEHLKFDVPTTYIDHNIGKLSYIDMQLMSLCKHNIIANSSFSWWGAWLNNNTQKTVIAPKQWFKTAKNIDIYPKDWICI